MRLRASCIEKRFSPVAIGARSACEPGLKLEIERISRFLVPEQRYGASTSRTRARLEIEAAVRVDRHLVPRAHDLDDRLDAPDIVGERLAADLELHHRIAQVEIALHLVLQRLRVLAGIVVAPAA
jgi:hypothetical protein